MKELFRERALTKVNYYQSLLEAEGIATFVKNENVSATEGVSIPDFFPALCVVHDDEYAAAVKLIKEDLKRSEDASSGEIVCGLCGQSSPATFDSCWNCQAELPQAK